MYEQNPQHDPTQSAERPQVTGNVQEYFRLAATILGLVMMLIGLCYSVRLFGVVRAGISQPEPFAEPIAKWEQIMGGEKLDVAMGDQTLRLARLLAVIAFGGTGLVLVYIAFGFVNVGAKIVSWTATDRQAIKRIILQALGRQSDNT